MHLGIKHGTQASKLNSKDLFWSTGRRLGGGGNNLGFIVLTFLIVFIFNNNTNLDSGGLGMFLVPTHNGACIQPCKCVSSCLRTECC